MNTLFPSAFRAHPWHGVDLGLSAPSIVTAYIEIVPTDTVKYEIDKVTGLLKIDRPQRFSNVCPSLYGFLPRTLCADRVGAFCMEKTGRKGIVGDGDPMDICVLTEKVIGHGDLLVQAIPIGGLRMLDSNEADDKIERVLIKSDVGVQIVQQATIAVSNLLGFREDKRPFAVHELGRVEPGLLMRGEAAIGPGLMRMPREKQPIRDTKPRVSARQRVGAGVEVVGTHQNSVRIAHRSGKMGRESVVRRYSAPVEPPVPILAPMVRSTILTWR